MKKLRWIFIRWFESIGLAGCFVWLLLISILLYGFYVFLPDYKYFMMLDKTKVPKVYSRQVVQLYQSPADPILAQMPLIENAPESIQTLFDTAIKHGLKIDEVVYKDEQKKGEQIVRYSMSFSVAASYPDIKAFIANVLAELPLLALEQLSFERNPNKEGVTAHLRFTLYMMT